jgi:hypothetical protein
VRQPSLLIGAKLGPTPKVAGTTDHGETAARGTLGSAQPRRYRSVSLVLHRGSMQYVPLVAPSLDSVYGCFGHPRITADQRARGLSPAQSRVPQLSRQDSWEVLSAGGSYRDGILYDDLLFVSSPVARIRCRQRVSQERSGGTK